MSTVKRSIPSSKGNLAAVVHYPETKAVRLAILCPGYLDSKDYSHLVALAAALSKQGYTVVRFEPTGTWESDGDISDYTTTQYLEDIKSVLDYMLQQKDYKHILLGGHSRGGMVSILYAARDPKVSAVLGIMPSSPRTSTEKRREEWQKTGFSISSRDLPDITGTKEFRVPYSHILDKDQYNVFEAVKTVKVPLILLAGELDESVLPEHVREIFDNANEPKKFITIAGIGHDYRHNDEEIKIVNKNILEQLNEQDEKKEI